MTIKTKLNDELRDQLDGLGKIELGSKEYTATVDGITKLGSLLADIEKFEAGVQEKERSQEDDYELKLRQIEECKKDRKLKIADLVVKTTLIVGGAYAMFRFEEKGTITTAIGRKLIGNFVPKL